MASEADPEARLVAMVSMVPFPLPVTVTLTSVLSFFLWVVAFTVALALLALATFEEAEAALRAAHTREVSRRGAPSALAALLTLTERSASRPLALEMAAKTRLGEARGSEATARRLMLVLRLSRIWLRMEAVTASAPTVWRRETRGVVSSSSWD